MKRYIIFTIIAFLILIFTGYGGPANLAIHRLIIAILCVLLFYCSFIYFSYKNTRNIEIDKVSNVRKRSPISQKVKDDVWNRDGGKCQVCGSNENLEFDHIIPFSEGGANTYRNLQLLCEPCNRKKSNNIG